ncbi:IS30 family transposase [Catellatospora bangladeshensis]|uniref:IS30 family transposase n=1 Tax=Catellatospora bangladeshensis TaxID=310355 RepID=A0A8J3JZE9_9ACTN|nr:IS30 family transposase [Catellatospora bangladeshensis]GIF86554.1 IS30 family transposase [Catellatospora bangladeshensis]
MAKAHVLTAGHRQVIENMWGLGSTYAQIATVVGVAVSSVWREIRRSNSSRHGVKNPLGATRGGLYRWGYRAGWAEAKAGERRKRPKARRLGDGPVRDQVVQWLRLRWSPTQIAGRLRTEFTDRPEMHVSHETIYQAVFLQTRGSLRELLDDALRSGRGARRSQSRAAQAARKALSGRPWVTEDIHIAARPAEATDRAVPGHWEGDLVIGRAGTSGIVTLVERSTRYVLLGALPGGRTSPEVLDVVRDLLGRLPTHLVRSLTWDQGNEMAGHAAFTLATKCPIYVCDPHAPWQRGTNENTNGLLRQYFPKGKTDFRTIDQAHLDTVAVELNGRPRQTLGWQTPAEALERVLVAPTV